MTTKTLASSLAALAMFAAQGAVEPVWESSLKGTTINAVGFENFALGATPATSDDDSGTADSSKAYFLYSGTSGDDQSVVTNHDNFAFNKIPNYFSKLDNSKYLSLSTEGGTLFRSLNVIDTSGESPVLGTAETIPDSGLFVDTLVQFTPCEEPPAFNDADLNKLAVWLGTETNATGDVVGTNLCVRAGYWDYENEILAKATGGKTYTLANTSEISVQAGEWVRLTVKAIQNVYSSSTVGEMPAFQVYINDTLAVFTEDVASAAALAQIGTLEAAAQTALATKTILPSMQDAAALQAVGFQGTGAVDDFVVTTEKPGFLAVDFTLYWDANILALEAYIDFEDQKTPTPETITIADLNKVFGSATAGQTLDIMIPGAGNTEVVPGYDIDWANTVMTNATAEPLLGDETDETSLYGYRFTLTGDGPYSVTLVTKSSLPPFDGGTGAENDPYLIGSAKSFTDLQTLVAGGNTFEGKFFKLSANVDFATLGLNPFAGIGVYNDDTKAFAGTFDGDNKTISNIVFTKRTYAGLFNQVTGGTIKNLVIDGVSFTNEGDASEWGGAAFVGYAKSRATLENLTAQNTAANATAFTGGGHNMAGIATKFTGAVARACTNKMDIVCDYTKCAGIVAFVQNGTGTFEACFNEGDLSGTKTTAITTADNGVGGILGWTANEIVLKDCSNTGTITVNENLPGSNPYKKAGLVAAYRGTGLYATNCTASADIIPVTLYGDATSCIDLTYATVDNGVATFVPGGELVKETQYKVMLPVASGTTAFTLAAENDWIEFYVDDTLATFAGTVDAATGLYAASTVSGNVVRYTATAKTDVSDAAIALDSTSATWSDQLAFPIVTVTAGGNTLAAADYTVAWTTGGVAVASIAAMEAGDDDIVYTATVTLNYSADQYILPASAPTATFTVSAPGGGGDLLPVNPDGAVVAVQAATAEAALAKVELKITDTAAATAGQASVVKLVATETSEGSGTWNVSVAIDEDAEAFVDPDEAVAVVAGVLSGSAASVEVAADKLTPGLYYSLAVSTEVDGTYTEGTRYLATGGENGKITLPITKPEGTKAFYKVLVNMTSGQE